MAKKTKKDGSRYMIILVLIVAASMLLSGLYYTGTSNRPQKQKDKLEQLIDYYNLEQIGNFSILITVSRITQDLIAVPDPTKRLSLDDVDNIINSQIDGVRSITCESTDLYTIFKFSLNGTTEDYTNNVRNEMNQKLRYYELRRGYIGRLPVNISGIDRVYIIGQLNTRVGDHARVYLFQKIKDGINLGLIGFEARKVLNGSVFPATVVNITDIMVQGVIVSGFNSSIIENQINLTDMNFVLPKFVVNKTLANETIGRIKKLEGVTVAPQGNKTTISFNSSMENIEEILNRENLSYSFENGGLMLKVPLNSSVENIEKLLDENRIENISFSKLGQISLPPEVIINDRLVQIRDNKAFSANLKIDTIVGDKINVSIATLQFGEQTIPFSANEVRENED